MKITRIGGLAAIATAGALVLASCAANETAPAGGSTDAGSSLSGTLDATGSSAQVAAEEAWVAGFQTANPAVTVNYTATGSGTGRDNFVAGKSQYIGSDATFTMDQVAAGGFGACASDKIVELPLYISAIAVAFNIDGVSSLNLTGETVAKIMLGKIAKWNDPEIAGENPGVTLPDLAISPVHRSDKSGTTENFTDYLAAVAPDVWTYGTVQSWPVDGGEAADKTSGVVAAINAGQGTVGYVDTSQVGSLGTAAIKVGGNFVSYSPEAAAAVVDASPFESGRGDGDLALKLQRDTTSEGVYPIVLVSYLIGCQEYADANTAALVSAYFTYAASADGQAAAAANAGSAPISDTLRAKVMDAIALIK